MVKNKLNCFKAYDIRGRVPEELDEDIAYRLGRAFTDYLSAHQVVVGYDIRLESSYLAKALMSGLNDGGADVINIGLCGTEEVYFQTFYRKVDGGIMITASHNPKGWNGMKIVRKKAMPISGDSGLFTIRNLIAEGKFRQQERVGNVIIDNNKKEYINHLISYVDVGSLKPLKLLVNPGNGAAGTIIRLLEKHLPFDFVLVNEEPDGNFPNGIPNPLLAENREITSKAVIEHGADMGIAWDGDFDRCFLYDAEGRFIEGYYLVGLIANMMLEKYPGERIIHDPRLTWNTIEQVCAAGGIPIQSKTGHAFIKERMRAENAIYGGEMSAHHYFRDFAYCDSGMVPWLFVTELMSRTGNSLADLVSKRLSAFPCSGEINYQVENPQTVLERVLTHFTPQKPVIDRTDGISIEFKNWRFNLRSSNTEPLLRLNVETRGNSKTLKQYIDIIEALILG